MESGEHPLFRMWRDRLDAELAQEAAWTARRAHREAEWKEWYAAWHAYKERLTAQVSAWALIAEFITAVGRFQIEFAGQWHRFSGDG